MPAYRPVVDKAVKWISAMIESGKIARGDTLPSIRHIARTGGISAVSAKRAVDLLRADGLLGGKKGARPFVVDSRAARAGEEELPPLASPLSSSSRIEAELHRQIALGELGPDSPFPSQKELQMRFRASHRTVRTVLQRLHRQGLLDAHKRWYCVRFHKAHRPSARVVLIGYSYGLNNAIIRGHHDNMVLGLLQMECWRRNMPIEQVGMSLYTGEIFGPEAGKPYAFPDDIFGCIVLLNQVADSWPHLFQTIASRRGPVAIIDEIGGWDVRTALPARGKTRVFTFSSGESAAREITRILLRCGNRRFAFLSPFGGVPWSNLRLQTVRDELKRSGVHEGLCEVDFDIQALTPELGDGKFAIKINNDITAFLQGYSPIVRQAYALALNNAMWGMRMTDAAIERNLRLSLRTLVKQREVTAWIAVNDQTALVAKSVALDMRRHLPADLSLASFDNSPEAGDAGLSSYDFNVSGLVSSVVNFITARFDSRTAFAAERVEIPGHLIERSSTGPAPA